MPAACLMKYVVGGVFVTCGASPHATLNYALKAVTVLHVPIALHDHHTRIGSAVLCLWIDRVCNNGRGRSSKRKGPYISIGLVTVCGNNHRDRCISLDEHTSTSSFQSRDTQRPCTCCGPCRGAMGRTLMSAVLALKSLQKLMMFRPACPSAGPTGGAGFACPALITSLIVAVTALAFLDMLRHRPTSQQLAAHPL